MKLLNKAEAAAALGISVSTLKRRMVNKTIEYTSTPQSKPGEATCFFTYAQLGLPEPDPAPDSGARQPSVPDSGTHSSPQWGEVPPAAIPLPYQDEPSDNLAEHPEPVTYRDSMGNKLNDPDPVSLLGPNPPIQRDSQRDLRYQPIRFHDPGKQAKRQGKPTGYSSPIEDPEYITKHWPGNYGTKTP